MKKHITGRKWKRHLRRRSKAEDKAARRFRDYLKRKRGSLSGKPRVRHEHFKKTSTLSAPEVLSLVENPSEVVQFLKRIRILGRQRNIYIDLTAVRTLTPDAIAAFLATIHHRDLVNAVVGGNLPADQNIRKTLEDSGFYEYVQRRAPEPKRVSMGTIRKRLHSGETFHKEFNQRVANELIEFATERLRGSRGYHPPTYSVLGEAMLNTLYHASGTPSDPEPWWASVYCDAERKRASFTFIDQGVGIFKSHRLGLRLNLAKHLWLLDHGDILRELMHGNIPSSSKIPGRGNGIPGMYNHCKAGRIKNLTVLANDAVARVETETFMVLNTAFDGTIIYWEVDFDCAQSRD